MISLQLVLECSRCPAGTLAVGTIEHERDRTLRLVANEIPDGWHHGEVDLCPDCLDKCETGRCTICQESDRKIVMDDNYSMLAYCTQCDRVL